MTLPISHEDTLFQTVCTGRSKKWTVIRTTHGSWLAAAPNRETDRDVHTASHALAVWCADANARQDFELEDMADLGGYDEANVNYALRRRP